MKTLKYLDYGLIQNGKKKFLRSLKDSDAYNLFHLAVRLKEKSKLIKLLKKKKINSKNIPRWQKFFPLYIFFYFSKCKKILELGSSSCELVEGIQLFDKFFKSKLTKNIKFYGIESYDDFNILVNEMYKKSIVDISIYKNVKSFIKKNKDLKNFFLHDYGVSMYAFDSTTKYVNFLNKFNSAFIKVAFFKNKSKFLNLSGTKTFYFNFEKFIKYLNKPIFKIYHDPKNVWSTIDNSDIISGYFYVGNDIKKLFENKLIKNFYDKRNFYIKRIK